MDYVVKALWIIMWVAAAIAAIDLVLLYICWRAAIVRDRVDTRMSQKRRDFWFSDEGQKELFRDYYPAGWPPREDPS